MAQVDMRSSSFRLGFSAGYCKEAELFFKEVISIPIYASLTREKQHKVIDEELARRNFRGCGEVLSLVYLCTCSFARVLLLVMFR